MGLRSVLQSVIELITEFSLCWRRDDREREMEIDEPEAAAVRQDWRGAHLSWTSRGVADRCGRRSRHDSTRDSHSC